MKLALGRVLKSDALGGAEPVPARATRGALPDGRLVGSAVLEADERARALLSRAEERARTLLGDAEKAALELRVRAEAEGRADAAASIAARVLALRERESQSDERALDRSVALARLLAERLLGESLGLDPERIVALARQALAEARGARQIALWAHPADAEILGRSLPALGLSEQTARIVPDPARARGQLRIETEIGTLDAELAPQLERLALRLRESLAQ